MDIWDTRIQHYVSWLKKSNSNKIQVDTLKQQTRDSKLQTFHLLFLNYSFTLTLALNP